MQRRYSIKQLKNQFFCTFIHLSQYAREGSSSSKRISCQTIGQMRKICLFNLGVVLPLLGEVFLSKLFSNDVSKLSLFGLKAKNGFQMLKVFRKSLNHAHHFFNFFGSTLAKTAPNTSKYSLYLREFYASSSVDV